LSVSVITMSYGARLDEIVVAGMLVVDVAARGPGLDHQPRSAARVRSRLTGRRSRGASSRVLRFLEAG
jgi:hypothetical protein